MRIRVEEIFHEVADLSTGSPCPIISQNAISTRRLGAEVEALVAFDSRSSCRWNGTLARLRSGRWRGCEPEATCRVDRTGWEISWDAAAWGPFIWPNAWTVRCRNE